MEISRHLDLGCGMLARNPYRAKELWGCDVFEHEQKSEAAGFKFVFADISRPPLPFKDNFFSSVSAFDVIEHVPRTEYQNGVLKFPFVSLMSEVFRILEPKGVFLASTPVFPHPSVFQDPTHVNFITDATHNYFCGPEAFAHRYGFKGQFSVRKAGREAPKNLHNISSSKMRKIYRNIEHIIFKGGLSHMTWELIAEK